LEHGDGGGGRARLIESGYQAVKETLKDAVVAERIDERSAGDSGEDADVRFPPKGGPRKGSKCIFTPGKTMPNRLKALRSYCAWT
jgi:hypothetical protein